MSLFDATCVHITLRVVMYDREGYHESRKCSRDTYPESYITDYTSVYEENVAAVMGFRVGDYVPLHRSP